MNNTSVRMFWVKVTASIHFAFMLLVLGSPLALLVHPELSGVVLFIMTATIISWLVWPLCVFSEIENWLRLRAKLKPMDKNYISFYAKLFFGICPSDRLVATIVYTFSALLWFTAFVMWWSNL